MKERNIHDLIIDCIKKMQDESFSPKTIEEYRQLWKRGIVPYMKTRERELFSDEISESFLAQLDKSLSPRKLNRLRRSVGLLLRFMQTGEMFKKKIKLKEYPLNGEIGSVALRFIEALRNQGYSNKTAHEKQVLLSAFIESLSFKGICRICDITADAIIAAIDYSQTCRELRFTAIRQFCTFLYEEGYTPNNIGWILGKHGYTSREKIPSTYSEREIAVMETSIERSSATGKRNYCIFLLASRLGLRASDIAALTWDNIDWDNNKITLYQYKTKRPIELPLFNNIGEALIIYICDGRPKSRYNNVFLSGNAPYMPMTTSSINSAISRIILSYGVDIKNRKYGPHSLRHSLASNLLRQGTSISTISAILGHENTQSTMTYIRVDVENLKKCVLDVPLVNEAFYSTHKKYFQ